LLPEELPEPVVAGAEPDELFDPPDVPLDELDESTELLDPEGLSEEEPDSEDPPDELPESLEPESFPESVEVLASRESVR
jgi:hypothetical protein